jgi:hypothetical protein
MRELYIEGVAIHGGPKSCVGAREGVGEALTGVRVGWAMEPRNQRSGVLTPYNQAEGNIADGAIARRQRTLRGSWEPVHARNLHPREPGGPTVARRRRCCPAQLDRGVAGRRAGGPRGEGRWPGRLPLGPRGVQPQPCSCILTSIPERPGWTSTIVTPPPSAGGEWIVTCADQQRGSALARRGRCASGGTPDPCHRGHSARPGVKLEPAAAGRPPGVPAAGAPERDPYGRRPSRRFGSCGRGRGGPGTALALGGYDRCGQKGYAS